MIALNGVISSAYIACFLPSVVKMVLPKDQHTGINTIGRVNTNYLLLTNLCLGVTNLLSLPNFDVSSTAQTIKANVFTYSVMIAAEYYHYKYYPNAYKKKFYIGSMVVNTILLLLTSIANSKLNAAFPNFAIRSVAKIPKKRRRKSSVTGVTKGNKTQYDGDIEDNDEEEKNPDRSWEKKGMTYWAQYYTQGLHNLTVRVDEDDAFKQENMNVCIHSCNNSQFKISQKVKGVVVGMF